MFALDELNPLKYMDDPDSWVCAGSIPTQILVYLYV